MYERERYSRPIRIGEDDFEYEVTEVITVTMSHRQDLPDGRVLRADPANKHWELDGKGYFDAPPPEWDESKAVPDRHVEIQEASYTY